MSNNIYDILKNFNNLDSVKNMLNEGKAVCKSCGKAKCKCVDESKGSKPDFLDMDKDGDTTEPMKKAAKTKSKGAVAEAVAQVERQLNEKYMGFKKTVGALKKQGGIENPEGLAASIGRKKYGKEKFQKAAAAGKKLGEGDYNEDMLSPSQKKIAQMSPPPDKIDANDLKALRAGKDKKKEGNAFSGAMAKAKATSAPSFKVGGKQYNVTNEGEYELDPRYKSPESDYFHSRKLTAPVAAWDNDVKGQQQYKDRTSGGVVNKVKDFVGYDKPNPAYGPKDKANEGFPTVADAKKRMDDRDGKTAHGKKTSTATGTKHERDYDAVDKGADVDSTPKGRGRPKKDRFA